MNKIDAEVKLTCVCVCVCVWGGQDPDRSPHVCSVHELLARCAFDLPFKC